jgi:hypothetical protein
MKYIYWEVTQINTDTAKENTETLIYVSKEIGLEVNTEGTKHMLLSRHLKKKTPWSESASELYRPSDRRLSAK